MDDVKRARETAYRLVDDWYTQDDDIRATIKQRRELISTIEAALAQARREGMEEAAQINELEQQVARLRDVLSRAMSLGAKICYAEPELSEYRDLREAARQLLTPVPYPDWCRHPDQCAGKASCQEDPTCAD